MQLVADVSTAVVRIPRLMEGTGVTPIFRIGTINCVFKNIIMVLICLCVCLCLCTFPLFLQLFPEWVVTQHRSKSKFKELPIALLSYMRGLYMPCL